MLMIALFLAAFAVTFFVFRMRGQKVADCIHKGLVAGILVSVVVFGVITASSYL